MNYSPWLIQLADSIFETYSLGELQNSSFMIEELMSIFPETPCEELFSALDLALGWKETEEHRGYLLH